MVKITFDKSAKRDVLDFFDKAVNEQGLIVEKNNPSQNVITPDNQEINVRDFGGVQKGSEVFIKSDLVSLIKLSRK